MVVIPTNEIWFWSQKAFISKKNLGGQLPPLPPCFLRPCPSYASESIHMKRIMVVLASWNVIYIYRHDRNFKSCYICTNKLFVIHHYYCFLCCVVQSCWLSSTYMCACMMLTVTMVQFPCSGNLNMYPLTKLLIVQFSKVNMYSKRQHNYNYKYVRIHAVYGCLALMLHKPCSTDVAQVV